MTSKSPSLFAALLCCIGFLILTQFMTQPVCAQIVWDKPKTTEPLANPYTMGVPREKITSAVSDMLKACGVEIDTVETKLSAGRIVTRPMIFSRGITVRNDLEHVSKPAVSEIRNWTKARYYLEILALPLDEKRSQLQVIAHVQGMVNDFSGSKWVDVLSNGVLEDEVIRGIGTRILGVDLNLRGSSGKSVRRVFTCE